MPNNANVDERVVEMRIDNRQFIDGANKTISVLDKLKNALSFRDAGDGVENVQKSFDKLDLSGVASDVEQISSRFSTLGVIGTQAIKNLTDKVVNFAENTIKGLTIDPIIGGFEKYNQILQDTYTILSATKQEDYSIQGYGTQLEYVNDQMELLMWYADETSATISDMTNTVGKLTSSGLKLANAASTAMGIYNVAYSAGATKNEAGRALYNFAQAMAAGTVKLMDWRSIENANMATLEFKQQILETAASAYAAEKGFQSLKKQADGTYKTMDGVVVTAENFAQTLQTGWFNQGVLEKVLTDYGEYSRRLQSVMTDSGFERYGYGSAQIADMLEATGGAEEKLIAVHDELEKKMGKMTPSIDSLRYSYELLTDAEIEVSRNAHKMGSEYHTFNDVLDATKDAVSTGWAKTFQKIIGDAEQAKDVWAAVGEEFYNIFAAGAADRNAILGFWADPSTLSNPAYQNLVSGRESLLNAIATLYRGIRTYVDPIVEAFNAVFSLGAGAGENDSPIELAAQKILELTYAFEEFTEKVALSDDAVEGIRVVFNGIFSAIKKGLGVFKPFFSVLGTGIGYIKDFIEIFFESFASGSFDFNYFLGGMGTLFENIRGSIEGAWSAAVRFYDSLKNSNALQTVAGFLGRAFGGLVSVFNLAVEKFSDIKLTSVQLENPLTKISELWNTIKERIGEIKIDTSKLQELFGKLGTIISTAYEGITGDSTAFKERFKLMAENAIAGIKEALKEVKLGDVLEGAKIGSLLYIGLEFAKFVSSFTAAAKKFESIPESISGVFNSLSTTIESYGKAKAADTMIKIAASILILTVAMVGLSFVPTEKLVEVATVLGILMAIMMQISKNLGETGKLSRNKTTITLIPKLAATIVAVAIFIIAAAGAIAMVGKLEWPDIGKGLAVIGILLVALVGSVALLEKLGKDESKLKISVLAKIIIFAATINAAAKAIAMLKDVNKETLLSAAASISLIMIIMGILIGISSTATVGGGVASFLVMLGMVGVMYAMVPLLAGLTAAMGGEDGGKKIWKAVGVLAAIAGIAVVFAGLMAAVGMIKGAMKGAVLLGVISASILALSVALLISVPAILAMVTGLVGVLEYIDKSISNMTDWERSTKVLVALGVAMVLLGAGVFAFGAGLLSAAAAFTVFSAGLLLSSIAAGLLAVAIVPLAKAFSTFCSILLDNWQAVLIVTAALVVLGVVVALISKKVDVLGKFMEFCGKVFKSFVDNGPQLLAMLAIVASGILDFIIQMIPMVVNFLMTAIITIINGTADSIRANASAIVGAIKNLISALLEFVLVAIAELLPAVIDLINNIFGHIIEGIIGPTKYNAMKEAISQWGYGAADAIRESLVDNTGLAVNGADHLRENVLGHMRITPDEAESAMNGIPEGVTQSMETAKTNAGSGATGVLNQYLASFSAGMPTVSKDVREMFGSAMNIDTAGYGDILGKNFTIGVGNGAAEEAPWLYNQMGTIASNASKSFANTLQIRSPSRVGARMGRYWDLGVVQGLEEDAGKINSTSETLAFKMVDSVKNAMSLVYALANDDFSISPVISPVVDMTGVTDSANSISSMLSGTSTVTGRVSQINRSISDLENLAADMQTISEARANTSQDTYEINIYPTPDMDEEAVADAVLDRLSSGVVRRGAALG